MSRWEDLQALWTTEYLFRLILGQEGKEPTPVQQAICRVADGLPLGELWDERNVRDAFAGKLPPEVAPRRYLVLAAARGGKSMIAAAKVVRCSLFCDLDSLSKSDKVRSPVLATHKDTAQPIYSHIKALAMALAQEEKGLLPDEPLVSSLTLRHPKTDHEVEIAVTALSAQGSTLVARWIGALCLDEAPRMGGESEYVRNLDEALRAVKVRVRPGGQELLIGSPYAPIGPVFDLVRKNEGRHTPALVVARASGPMLNPSEYTPEKCEEIKREDPLAYQTDVLGHFADAEATLIPSDAIERACKEARELGLTERPRRPVDPNAPPDKREYIEYVATLDPATRGNAWTLVILGAIGEDEYRRPVYEQAYAEQWQGTPEKPLKPREVLTEIRDICQKYGLTEALSDEWSIDSLSDIAESLGFTVLGFASNADTRKEYADLLKDAIVEGRLHLLDDRQQRVDLQRVKKRPTTNGVTIQLPTSGDGRHCDFVPALGLALKYPPNPPIKPGPGTRGAMGPRPKKQQHDARSLLRTLTG